MLPHMTDAASILSPGVTIGELCKALGNIPRSTLLRAVGAGEIPDADRRTSGGDKGVGHRRWSYALARKIVEARGRKAPKAWGST
jgi:hypothetical protein